MSKKIFYKLKLHKLGKLFREKVRNKIERKKIKNSDFTILSNNCIGGIMAHDLGKRFLSPTINLYIKPTDFVKMMENLEYYLSLEIEPIETKLKYPVRKIRRYYIIF